jgi:four helix bundle protein
VLGAGCRVPGAECGGTGIASVLVMGVRRYEDLVAWQLANELKQNVYALVDRSMARNDRRFCDQIKDSAASAPRNLAEGFACYRHPEFARYTRIAKASLTETHNHLGDGVDRRHWPPQEVDPLKQLANRAVGACVRLLQFLESTDAPHTRTRRR